MTTEAGPFVLSDLPADVREQIYDHVFAADDHEVGGVLVGDVGPGRKAEVHGMIPALEASGARASVTFTHEAWERILAAQERDFPDSPMIIGWYHSHPGFGIFLSEHDVFIQQNFFREQHQIAYVVDPQDETEGIFGWRDGRIELLEEARTPRRRGQRRPGMVVELDDADDGMAEAASIDFEQRAVPAATPRRAIALDEDETPKRRRRGLIPLGIGVVLLAGAGAALAIGRGGSSTPSTPTTTQVSNATGVAARVRASQLTSASINAGTKQAQVLAEDQANAETAWKIKSSRPKNPKGGNPNPPDAGPGPSPDPGPGPTPDSGTNPTGSGPGPSDNQDSGTTPSDLTK